MYVFIHGKLHMHLVSLCCLMAAFQWKLRSAEWRKRLILAEPLPETPLTLLSHCCITRDNDQATMELGTESLFCFYARI